MARVHPSHHAPHAGLPAQAQAAGVFEGSAVDHADGFIHFSSAAQAAETARRHFAGQADLVVLEIEADDLGAALVESSRGSIYCLTIIGQVEGHSLAPNNTKTTKYEHVLPLLAHLEQSEEVDGVLLLLNTVGGDIEAGLAIAEMVAGMTKPTVTLVLGGGHSIGIPLAVSGQQTFIVPSASMTVHPVRMSGLMIAAPQSYRYFERVQESIVSFVARHSRITQDDFRQLMLADGDMSNDVGTILYGSQAVQLGLIDRLGTLSDALEALYGMIGKNG